MSAAHVIGGGLAGLSAALALADAGRAVTVYEAGPQAGGRCRSYDDRELGCRVDNGNHLLLSGNRAAFAYIDRIGARETFTIADEPRFPFMDLDTSERWVLRPNTSVVPWWVLSPSRRVPGTRASDYLTLRAWRRPPAQATVAALLRPGQLARRLIEPLAVAALNTPIDRADAGLMAAVIADTLMRGGAACLPAIPRLGLSESLIDPAVAALSARGGRVLTGRRIAALTIEGGRVTALRSPDGPVPVAPGETVVLAVPPWVARDLLPGLAGPTEHQAILNVHFRLDAPPAGAPAFIGLVGGTAEWVFVKPGHVSVTISAANRLADKPAEWLAEAVWPDVRTALRLDMPMPRWRVVKEKRATFAATAVQGRLRPAARTALANLTLAGDWTATGLPATIEGAIRSGRTAADTILGVAA
jgi:squalene-associated FAD-dependent desaturase